MAGLFYLFLSVTGFDYLAYFFFGVKVFPSSLFSSNSLNTLLDIFLICYLDNTLAFSLYLYNLSANYNYY